MTLTLDIPGDVQAALTQAAEQQGQTPEQAALIALRRAYGPAANGSHANEAPTEDDQAAQRASLFAILDRAETETLDPPDSPTRKAARESAFGQIVREKYRRRGFNL